MTIEQVGVIGGGLMGSGIAEVCARAGSDVIIHEINAGVAEAARARVEASLNRAVEKGKLEQADRDSILERIWFSTELSDQADRQLVIEAATEEEGLKKSIFTDLDAVVAPDSILASNTSSIPITRIAAATSRPDRVVGLHFFNPVPVMGLIELVTTVMTSPETERTARAYAESLGKTVIQAPDRAGFIVNMLLVPYLIGAIRMLRGWCSQPRGHRRRNETGCKPPDGAARTRRLRRPRHDETHRRRAVRGYKDPFYASPPLLTRMVEAGLLWRKTGRGFYEY